MATNNVTNASVCTIAADLMATMLANNPDVAEKFGITEEVAAKMANHASKLRSASASQSGPTKEQRANDVIIDALRAHLAETGEALSAAEVAAWLDNSGTLAGCNVHKATGLVTRGCKDGRISKVYDKTKVFYTAA